MEDVKKECTLLIPEMSPQVLVKQEVKLEMESDPDSSNDGLDVDQHSKLVGWTSFTFPGIKEEIEDESEVFGGQDLLQDDLESSTRSTTNFENHLIKKECTEDIAHGTNNEQTSNKSIEIKEENNQTQDDTISEGIYKESDQQTDKIFYSCIHCDRSFSKIGHLSLHEKGHIEEKPHVCRECGKCFKFKGNLNRHSIVHSDTSPYHCKVCDKSFTARHHFSNHSLLHSDAPTCKCDVCGRYFKLHNRLTLHGESKSNSDKCEVCDRCLKLKYDFTQRILVKKRKEDYKCEECDLCFKTRGDLQVHTREHRYDCEGCGRCFKTKHMLAVHSCAANPKERTHKCNVCNKRFLKEKDVARHKTQNHTNQHLCENLAIHQLHSTSGVVFECCAHARIGRVWGGRRDSQEDRALLLSQCRLWRDAVELNTAIALANYATEAAVELNTTSALANYATEAGDTKEDVGINKWKGGGGLEEEQGTNGRSVGNHVLFKCRCARRIQADAPTDRSESDRKTSVPRPPRSSHDSVDANVNCPLMFDDIRGEPGPSSVNGGGSQSSSEAWTHLTFPKIKEEIEIDSYSSDDDLEINRLGNSGASLPFTFPKLKEEMLANVHVVLSSTAEDEEIEVRISVG
uniref:C2H2-type domain-containing protein n=1 Tax=Timema shepardi TaxID=629360 RepID=A0A7R9B481_TIMSH|nr:unnamed protein product [Timema shepardi]